MTDGIDFDALARQTVATDGAMEALNDLYGAAFRLPQWHFIARGELPNVNPYIASNAEYAGGRQMVRAFTDTERLMRFARENGLTDADGSARILSLPTGSIVEYLEQFVAYGVHGIWFNSDTGSDGFFVPLQQLRPIREHLARLDAPAPVPPAPETVPPAPAAEPPAAEMPITEPPAAEPPVATLIVIVKDGLMLPSGFVSPASYTCNFFCRVPPDWLAGDGLREERLEQIYRRVYGETWRDGNSDGSRYVVLDSFTKVFAPDVAKGTQWSGTANDKDNHYWFYLATPDGEVRSVTAEEFQQDVDAKGI